MYFNPCFVLPGLFSWIILIWFLRRRRGSTPGSSADLSERPPDSDTEHLSDAEMKEADREERWIRAQEMNETLGYDRWTGRRRMDDD